MKGILMTPANLQAIVEDRKTVTRRLSGLREINKDPGRWAYTGTDGVSWGFRNRFTSDPVIIKPRYLPSEICYLKQTYYAYGCWKQFHESGKSHWEFYQNLYSGVWFKDNKPKDLVVKRGHGELGWYKRSPLFLEAEFARHFIKILSAKPERLKSITLEDCWDEGISVKPAYNRIESYHHLWNSINPDYPWDSNPWLWVYRFIRCDREGKAIGVKHV